MPNEQKKSRLKAVELAAIDLVITALQAGHRRIDFVSKDDNPREQMAEALAQIHGGVEPTERDQEIIGKGMAPRIRSLFALQGGRSSA